jgi:hypothetical protein
VSQAASEHSTKKTPLTALATMMTAPLAFDSRSLLLCLWVV